MCFVLALAVGEDLAILGRCLLGIKYCSCATLHLFPLCTAGDKPPHTYNKGFRGRATKIWLPIFSKSLIPFWFLASFKSKHLKCFIIDCCPFNSLSKTHPRMHAEYRWISPGPLLIPWGGRGRHGERRSQLEVKSNWIWSEIKMNRSDIEVGSKCTRSEIEMNSKWNRSEIEVKSEWNRSEIEVKSNWAPSRPTPKPPIQL